MGKENEDCFLFCLFSGKKWIDKNDRRFIDGFIDYLTHIIQQMSTEE